MAEYLHTRSASRRIVLTALCALPAVGAAAGPLDHPDAFLIALGEALKRASTARLNAEAADDEEALTAAYLCGCALIDQIEEVEARTTAGLRVKAEAVAWICHPDQVCLGQPSVTKEMMLSDQVLTGLIVIEGGRI